MHLLSSSCGNDSVAMLYKALRDGVPGLQVVYCHTGWAAEWWPNRIERVRAYCGRHGVPFVHLQPVNDFSALMIERKGFPMPGKTWCSFWLKAMPFLLWADQIDPECKATILIGKRRDESYARRDTPAVIESSENHGGRRVEHPLAFVDEWERDEMCAAAGFEVLPTRSQECAPCVNANRTDMRALSGTEIVRTISLERKVGQNMFRPHHHMGAKGFEQVMVWARSPRGKYEPPDAPSIGCTEGYCE
jgi:3'-phosphoadenosine 5'-phosphosulfate sulfotransferase (PAPS reductase)/FAD synthetase